MTKGIDRAGICTGTRLRNEGEDPKVTDEAFRSLLKNDFGPQINADERG